MVGISPSHLDESSVSSSRRHEDVYKSEHVPQRAAMQQECKRSDFNSSWNSDNDFGDFRPKPPQAPLEESCVEGSESVERKNENLELEASTSWNSTYDFGDSRPKPPRAPLEESCVEGSKSVEQKDKNLELEASTSWNSTNSFGDFRPKPPRAPLEESCVEGSKSVERKDKSLKLEASTSWNSTYDFGDFRPEPPRAPLEIIVKLSPELEDQQGEESACDIDDGEKTGQGKTSVCELKLPLHMEAQGVDLNVKCDSVRSSSWESAYGYGDFRPEPPKAPIEDAEVLQQRTDSISQACDLQRSSSWQSAHDFGDFRPEPPTAPLEDDHASIHKIMHSISPNNELERSASWHSAYDFGDFRPEPSLAPPEEIEQIRMAEKNDDFDTYLTTTPLEVSQTLEQEPLNVSQAEEHGVEVTQDSLCDASLSRNSVFNVAESTTHEQKFITDRANDVDMPDVSTHDVGVRESLYEESDEEKGDNVEPVARAQTLEQATSAVVSCEQDPTDNQAELLTCQTTCANSTIMLSPTPLRVTSSATAFLVQALQSPEKRKATGNFCQSETNRTTSRQCENFNVASPCVDTLQQSQSSTILFPHQRSASSRGPAVRADRVIADWDRLASLLPGGMDVLARHKREALFARWDPDGLRVLSLDAIRNGMHELLGQVLTTDVITHAFEVAYRIATKTVNFTSIEVLDSEGFRLFLVYITRFFEIMRCLVEPDTSGELKVTFHDLHKTKALFDVWGCPEAFENAIASSAHVFSKARDRSVTFDVFAHWLISHCIEHFAGEHENEIQEAQQASQDECKTSAITSNGTSEDGSGKMAKASALDKTNLNVPSVSALSQTRRPLSKQSHGSRGSSRNSSASKTTHQNSSNCSRATSRIGSRASPPSVPSQIRAPSPNRLPNTTSRAGANSPSASSQTRAASPSRLPNTPSRVGSRANSPSASSQTRARSTNRLPDTPSSASRPPIGTPVRNSTPHAPANSALRARMDPNVANVAQPSREQQAHSQESQTERSDNVGRLPQLRESALVVTQNARPHSAGQSRRSAIGACNVPRPPSRPGSARIPKSSGHERPVETASISSRSRSFPPLRTQEERKKSVPEAMDREALRAHLKQHTQCTRARLEAFQGPAPKNRYDRDRQDCAVLGPIPGWRRF